MEYIVEAVSSILPKKRRKKLPRKIPFFDELLFIGSITNGTKTRWTDLRLEKRRRRRRGGGEAEEEARWRCTPRLACTRAPARVDKLIPALYRVIVKHAVASRRYFRQFFSNLDSRAEFDRRKT